VLHGPQRPRVVDVDGGRRDAEVLVGEAHEVTVGPHPQAAVLGQAVAADARAREDHVGVRGPHPDGADDLDQVHPVLLAEGAPLVQEGQDGGAVAVLHDLGRLALNGPVEHGERELLHVEHLGEELLHPGPALVVDAAAHTPEVADGPHVVPARHDPLVAVSQQRLGVGAAPGEGPLHDGVRDVLGGAGRNGGLDEDQA